MLARLARVFLLVAVLAGWQAALEHPVEHSGHSPEDRALCGALDALAACAPKASALDSAAHFSAYEVPSRPLQVPRPAQAPPFLAHGPPAAA